MGRKKKKKRPEETSGLGASVEPQAEAGFDSSDDGEVGEDELTGPQLLTAEPARKLKAAPAVAGPRRNREKALRRSRACSRGSALGGKAAPIWPGKRQAEGESDGHRRAPLLRRSLPQPRLLSPQSPRRNRRENPKG